MSKLFEPLNLSHITLPNRIVVSPMCQYSAEDGYANNWHLVHLGQFAIGRAGAVIQEATAVSAEGRISNWDLGIWEDGHIEKYLEITGFIRSQGSIPGIQLAHAGRKASTQRPWEGRGQYAPDEENGWQTVAPSPLPFNESDIPPQELSLDEISALVGSFRSAARRAVMAGYQIIEIHGAHGYLIHQFLSPLVNKRTDGYGGSFGNRIRFLCEVVDAVKSELNQHSLWVRLSGTDWAEGGWDVEQTVRLSRILKEKGVDVIDVSSGGAVRYQQIPVGLGYQVPLAQAVKSHTGITTGAVGLIKSGTQAERILAEGNADLVLIARAFLNDPHFVYHSAKELQVDLTWPPQYARAKE